jgi:tetratricopeptide (TPR) repeat protein
MGESFKITQLAVYNPQRLDDKTFNALFVARAKVFKYLIGIIKDEKPNSIPQHHLIIAARGMGKTMLLKRIETELKSPELKKLFIPILYPEEQYNISSLNDLWLNSLDKFADIMDAEGDEILVDEIDKKVEAFQKTREHKKSNNEVFDYFISLTKRLKRRPVLLIDNINFIFERLSDDQQHQLRNLLCKNSSPIVVAASPVKVEKVLEYGAPFYDAFLINHLEKLGEKELLLILNNLAKLTGSKKIPSEIKKHLSRLRAINQLTGGNPRTTVMLFKLITRGFSNSIIDDLDALLDDITPLYKARFEEELSDQLQQIMNAIAINWDPLGIKKISELTGLVNTKLSPQLLRLVNSGWLTKKPGFKTKSNVYEVSERFFNIWYLMRQSSRRHKKQVGYLSKFLVSLYGDEINAGAKNLLSCKSEKADHFIYNLAIAESLSDKKLRKQIIEKCRYDLNCQKYLDVNQKSQIEVILKQFEESEEISSEVIKKIAKVDNSLTLFLEAYKLAEEGKYEEAVKKYENCLTANPKLINALNNLGNLYQNHFSRFEDSEQCYKKALEIDPKYIYGLNSLGNLYQKNLKRYEDSEQCYKKALEIDPKFTYALNGLGSLYMDHFRRYEDSEQCYKKALEIDPKYTYALNNLGILYMDHFNRYQDSEHCYKKALEIDSENIFPKFNLIFLLRDKMNMIDEAKELFLSLKGFDHVKDSYYLNFALFHLYEKNSGLAEKDLDKALKCINQEFPITTQDDWWRFAAVTLNLKYGDWLVEILENAGYNKIISPYYEAVKSLTYEEPEAYLESKAVEIKNAALIVLAKIRAFM